MNTSQQTVTSDNLRDTLHTCLDGAHIFSLPSIHPYIAEIRQLISMPNGVYADLYMPTFYHFMSLCQNMPEDMQNPVPYSLLKRRLELAIATLKLRCGCMLPQHSNSETVAEQEPLWAYALFTASLLINIHHIQSDRSIELYQTNNKRLGIWHPIVGSLYEENTYYKISSQPSVLLVEKHALQTELVGKIIPAIGLRWLSSYPELFSLWFRTITSAQEESNVLMQLLQQAAQAISFPLGEASKETISNESRLDEKEMLIDSAVRISVYQPEAAEIMQSLLDWLIQETRKQEGKMPKFLRISEGLFITIPVLERFIQQDSIALALDEFLKTFSHIFLEKEGKLFSHYCSIHFENRQIFEGVILKQEHLNETLKARAIQTDFMPNISL